MDDEEDFDLGEEEEEEEEEAEEEEVKTKPKLKKNPKPKVEELYNWKMLRQPEMTGIVKGDEFISDIWEVMRRILSKVEDIDKNTR